jgi:PAS domain S-box-containing protein
VEFGFRPCCENPVPVVYWGCTAHLFIATAAFRGRAKEDQIEVRDLQTFVDCLEDAVVVIDENYGVVLANAAALRSVGRPAEEVLYTPCYRALHGQTALCDNRPFGACAVQTVRATGQPARVRHRHPDASGSVHVVEISASPLPGRDRGSSLVVELMRDVTRQAELEVETARRHRELTVLNQIALAVVRSLDLETLAPELLDLVMPTLQADCAAIYQFHDGQPAQAAHKGVELPCAIIDALSGEAAARDLPLILHDVRAEARWAALLPATTSLGSLLCMPLANQKVCHGMLVLGNSLPRAWEEPDVHLVAMAARQIAIGLERTRLFHAERERAHSLEEANCRLLMLEQARRQALRRAMTAQEDERKRIAAELHDDTAQALAALIVGMDTAAAMLEHSPAAAHEQLAHLKRSTGGIIEEIDSIIAALRPALLDDMGLLPALRAYAADRLDPLGVAWEFHVGDNECHLLPSTEMALFRVVQEAISNIARHAQAHQVYITVLPEVEGTTVQVSDDGVGFDVSEKLDLDRRQPSLGLLGMQERLATVNGRLHIQSTPGQGTQLRIYVPCEADGGIP